MSYQRMIFSYKNVLSRKIFIFEGKCLDVNSLTMLKKIILVEKLKESLNAEGSHRVNLIFRPYLFEEL